MCVQPSKNLLLKERSVIIPKCGYIWFSFFISVFFIFNDISAQAIDTIFVFEKNAKKVTEGIQHGDSMLNDSVSRIIYTNLNKYFVFLNEHNCRVKEGRWSGTHFFCPFKYYHKDGTLAGEGSYTSIYDSIYEPYQKVGRWKYYENNVLLFDSEYKIDILTKKCETKKDDTIKIRANDINKYVFNANYSHNNGWYIIQGKSVTEDSFKLYVGKHDSIKRILKCKSGNYFVMLDDDDSKIEEGRWHIEYYVGPYKNYYPNGKVKSEGEYSDWENKIYMVGQKIGKWKYYREDGKIDKVINHVPSEDYLHKHLQRK